MFKNLSTEKQAIVESLQKLGFKEDLIAKGLNITPEEETKEPEKKDDTTIVKSISEQIAAKKAELEILEVEATKIEKSEAAKNPESFDFAGKLDEISKSLNSQIEKSNTDVENRFEGLTDLVKSLTDVISKQNEEFAAIKTDNEKQVKDNEEFKKSFTETADIVNKIADYSPGLRSMRTNSGAGHVERFEKSENGNNDGKEIMSLSTQKGEISTKLSGLLDTNVDIRKSLDNDIASFEVSNRVTPRLDKVFKEELNIQVVQ